MSEHATPYTTQQIGYRSVRFSSKGIFDTHKDQMVDPYAATRIPKEHQVQGFQFWPQEKGKFPCVILLHDKWGLTPDAKDLAMRLACEGYVVMLPNVYGRQGGMVTANAEVAEALAERIDLTMALQDINASCEFLNANLSEDPNLEFTVRNAHAAIGLGLGGTLALLFALKRKRLRTAVSFYGKLPDPLDSLKNVHCPLLYHAAETDNAATPEELAQITKIVQEAGKTVEIRHYPGTGIGFCDPVQPERYNESSAKQAWDDTIAFLKKQLPV